MPSQEVMEHNKALIAEIVNDVKNRQALISKFYAEQREDLIGTTIHYLDRKSAADIKYKDAEKLVLDVVDNYNWKKFKR